MFLHSSAGTQRYRVGVVLPEHQHRLFQAFPFCSGAACPVLEDFLAAGAVQRLKLQAEILVPC